jgi:short-subunit dehydrogenase
VWRKAVFHQRTAGSSSAKESQEAPRESQCVHEYSRQNANAIETARLAEGARVAITAPNPKTLRAAAAELGDGVLAIQADVTDVEATDRAVATVAEKFGKLDIVFANAGIGGPTPVGQTSQATRLHCYVVITI